MYEVNRSVIILRPKQPFLDWLQSLPGELDPALTLTELRENGNAILVPAVDRLDELHEFLSQHCLALFEAELADWCEEDRLWPQPLTPTLFAQWFDVGVHGVVTDLVEEPLERERFLPFDLSDE
ncbi:MAG: VacJ [Paludibacterium sp.]|uniref:VacJ n=1 Tax=Paludibacterium sp. TaxID=1917523 RepID=UPI0025FF725C|nr:VacJ [Paludibacterium sp.]MBV8046000.1 VacJ [Paludibacterium sp.]MBV8648569.1 VacJ [Paludibacterium sp.]